MSLTEIIVTYNAKQLGYDPDSDALSAFAKDPKPDAAFYIENNRFGVGLGAIIATYTTQDPEGLVRSLEETYGAAISYVEEGSEKHTLDTNVAEGSGAAEDAGDQ